jgi:hypothetical protein
MQPKQIDTNTAVLAMLGINWRQANIVAANIKLRPGSFPTVFLRCVGQTRTTQHTLEFDIDQACEEARARVKTHIDHLASLAWCEIAKHAIRYDCAEYTERHGLANTVVNGG